MKGRRLRNRTFQQNTHNTAEEYCICPQCGHVAVHVKGRPCRGYLCPVCHIPLMRNQNNFQSKKLKPDTTKSETGNIETTKTKTLKYPKVNTELCIGCGICISACPKEAISLTNGKACINEDTCINCRICENKCPVAAIS